MEVEENPKCTLDGGSACVKKDCLENSTFNCGLLLMIGGMVCSTDSQLFSGRSFMKRVMGGHVIFFDERDLITASITGIVFFP